MTDAKHPVDPSASLVESEASLDQERDEGGAIASEGPAPTPASALLQFAGTWVGDDLQECLELVYLTRGKAQF